MGWALTPAPWSYFNRRLLHGKSRDRGKYLSSSRFAKARVEGNCNERGGAEEYNLTIGQKRAKCVRRGLVPTCASDPALESVSCGKDLQPTWATTNRRGRRTGALKSTMPRDESRGGGQNVP
jgi:hypothetical protein